MFTVPRELVEFVSIDIDLPIGEYVLDGRPVSNIWNTIQMVCRVTDELHDWFENRQISYKFFYHFSNNTHGQSYAVELTNPKDALLYKMTWL